MERLQMYENVYVAGISWPRSGHHMVARTLRKYFGEKFSYCEFYNPEDCCRVFPCARAGTINFSKNHDFNGSLSRSQSIDYLIQYHAFLPSVVSNFELYIKSGAEDSTDSFCRFVSTQLAAYSAFVEKWVESEFSDRVTIVKYEDLIEDPAREMKRVISLFEPARAIDVARLESILSSLEKISVTQGETVRTEGGVVQAREIAEFRYYDVELFEDIDNMKLTRDEVLRVAKKFRKRPLSNRQVIAYQALQDIGACEKAMSSDAGEKESASGLKIERSKEHALSAGESQNTVTAGSPVPAHTVIHLHIPKSGGSSLNECLLTTYGTESTLSNMSMSRLQQLSDKPKLQTYKLVQGHLEYGAHEYFTNSCLYLFLLREPRRRVYSLYNFARQRPQNPIHEFTKGVTFGEFLDLSLSTGIVRNAIDNVQVKIVAGRRKPVFTNLQETLRIACHIAFSENCIFGLTEHFTDYLNRLYDVGIIADKSESSLNVYGSSESFREVMENLTDNQLQVLEGYVEWDERFYKMCQIYLDAYVSYIEA